MPKTRLQKKEILLSLADKFNKAKAVVFVNFKGLRVKEAEELRKLCRQEKVEIFVAKKTLVVKVLQEKGLSEISAKSLPGELASVFGYEEAEVPAKVLAKFAKDHENLKMVAGIFEGKKIEVAMLQQLASLPSRQELLAKLVGSLQAPLSGLVRVLQGNLRSLVYIFHSLKEKKSA